MAKLDDKHREQTASAGTGFAPIPDGTYHLRLRSVDPERNGPKGPYWSWEFDVVDHHAFTPDGSTEEQDVYGRRLWNNTSLSEDAAFKMREAFDAFGADYDADTDDLCGRIVRGQVSTRTIQAGARKGELSNQIDKLMPKDPGFEAPEGGEELAAAGGSKTADDLF